MLMITPTQSYRSPEHKGGLAGRIRRKLTAQPLSVRLREIFYWSVFSLIRPLVRKGHFSVEGRPYAYANLRKNLVLGTERSVEIPLAIAFVEAAPRDSLLEIGNVLGQYTREPWWPVIDLYEAGDRVINVDIVDYLPDKPFEAILSVSTLEHVGFNEDIKDPEKLPQALHHIRHHLLAPGGRLLVTLPLGWNPVVDSLFREGALGFDSVIVLKRSGLANQWTEIDQAEAVSVYGRYLGADYLLVAEYRKPLTSESLGGV